MGEIVRRTLQYDRYVDTHLTQRAPHLMAFRPLPPFTSTNSHDVRRRWFGSRCRWFQQWAVRGTEAHVQDLVTPAWDAGATTGAAGPGPPLPVARASGDVATAGASVAVGVGVGVGVGAAAAAAAAAAPGAVAVEQATEVVMLPPPLPLPLPVLPALAVSVASPPPPPPAPAPTLAPAPLPPSLPPSCADVAGTPVDTAPGVVAPTPGEAAMPALATTAGGGDASGVTGAAREPTLLVGENNEPLALGRVDTDSGAGTVTGAGAADATTGVTTTAEHGRLGR